MVTNRVNTGIYVISPRAMERVPENTPFDFAKDLFPLLLEKGEKLLGCPLEGYWCDIGTPKSYYECCADALSGRLCIELAGGFESSPNVEPDPVADDGMGSLEYNCADRARLMEGVSAAFLELGADYSDGFRLRGEGYELHIAPLPDTAALRISANAADAETATELTASAARLIKEIENRLDK